MMKMDDALNSYVAMEHSYKLVKDLGFVLHIKHDRWILHNSKDGVLDEDEEEVYVTGATPFELIHFLKGFRAGLQSTKVYEPK